MKRRDPRRKIKPEQAEWALDQLLNHRVPISVLAKRLGVSVSVMRGYLKELHPAPLPLVYPPRERRLPEADQRMKEIVRLRHQGLLQKEIAERFGISSTRVYQILREAEQLGLCDGRSIVIKLRQQQIRREAYARKFGRSVWDLPRRRRVA